MKSGVKVGVGTRVPYKNHVFRQFFARNRLQEKNSHNATKNESKKVDPRRKKYLPSFLRLAFPSQTMQNQEIGKKCWKKWFGLHKEEGVRFQDLARSKMKIGPSYSHNVELNGSKTCSQTIVHNLESFWRKFFFRCYDNITP